MGLIVWIILGVLIHYKGDIHWKYYRDNLNIKTSDYSDYSIKEKDPNRSWGLMFTFYLPFFNSLLFENELIKNNRQRKTKIYWLLGIWWLVFTGWMINQVISVVENF